MANNLNLVTNAEVRLIALKALPKLEEIFSGLRDSMCNGSLGLNGMEERAIF